MRMGMPDTRGDLLQQIRDVRTSLVVLGRDGKIDEPTRLLLGLEAKCLAQELVSQPQRPSFIVEI